MILDVPKSDTLADSDDSAPANVCSIRRASAYNRLPPHPVVSVVLKGYFDGSVSGRKYITLAGLAGSFDAWDDLESTWTSAVAEWKPPHRPNFKTWHCNDAFTLNGEFRAADGWSQEEVRRVFNAVFNNCLGRVCFHRKLEFCASSATVDMDDYRRACAEFPDLPKVKPAEALLVDLVLSQAISLLPVSASGEGHTGKLELIFDRGESFLRHVNKVFERGHKHWVGRLIASLTKGASEDFIALQATDMLAWSTNRHYASGERDREFYGWMLKLMVSIRHKLFLYDDIVFSYRRAKAISEEAAALKAQRPSRPS